MNSTYLSERSVGIGSHFVVRIYSSYKEKYYRTVLTLTFHVTFVGTVYHFGGRLECESTKKQKNCLTSVWCPQSAHLSRKYAASYKIKRLLPNKKFKKQNKKGAYLHIEHSWANSHIMVALRKQSCNQVKGKQNKAQQA